MQTPLSLRALSAALAASSLCLLASAPGVRAAIGASSDTSKPSQSSSYLISGGPANGTVQINENVLLDPTAGPWQKSLMNNGQGRDSGDDVRIVETLINAGTTSWTDWHEHVFSTTLIGGGMGLQPGFLFHSTTLNVSANYGSGLVPLVQGVDYTLTPTVYSGPGGTGNDGNWSGIDIFLQPGRAIGPGNTLSISKNIFEVFLNGEIWVPNEAAIISEYPTPEPTGVVGAIGAALVMFRRRRRIYR